MGAAVVGGVAIAGKVASAAGAIAGTIGKLFGAAPRGNYAKFTREALPLCVKQSSATGIPVDLFWFEGEIIRVMPDGAYAVVSRAGTLDAAFAYWKQLAESSEFYVLKCADTLVGCNFELWGQGNPIATIPGWTAPTAPAGGVAEAGVMSGGLMLFLIAGTVVGLTVYILRGGKK